MLDKKFKNKLVRILKSGKYKQGKHVLYRNLEEEYCCIGVVGILCGIPKEELLGKQFLKRFPRKYNIPKVFKGDTGTAYKLALMNDAGDTFSEIADYIKENL